MVVDLSKSVGPYTGVSRDLQVEFVEPRRKFRLILYGAFNAYGLIGSECNGILILDQDKMHVLCDEIEREGTGYFGPSSKQVETFEKLASMGWDAFRSFVNGHPRKRYSI